MAPERGSFSWNTKRQLHPPRQHPYIHQQYCAGHTPAADWLAYYQPEVVIAIGGLKPKVKSARLLKTGESVTFTQDEFSLRLTGLALAGSRSARNRHRGLSATANPSSTTTQSAPLAPAQAGISWG